MAKNNALINMYRDLQKRNKELVHEIKKVTPEVYAGIALALHRELGWGYVRINRLFTSSQYIWYECNEKGIDMSQLCLEETGVDVRLRTEADNEETV